MAIERNPYLWATWYRLEPTLTSASTDLFHREKKDSEILSVYEGAGELVFNYDEGPWEDTDGGGAPPLPQCQQAIVADGHTNLFAQERGKDGGGVGCPLKLFSIRNNRNWNRN
jgi:hypothetical protein